jgi:acetyl/propionyl-CoA carboxylase alpha subunit
MQVFGDRHGNVVHLFERDCSLQRRHQKVIEEAPAPGMDEATRAALCEAAVKAARAVNYVNAGTVEFIADASEALRADRIWFMEMNTRLQVEHPVTEEITGQDLVEWQLRVASGEKLPLKQEELKINGHAIEARLYAEDPSTGFLPSIGPLLAFDQPENVRVDTGVELGDEISSHYDAMIAKVIAHAPTRVAAIARLSEAMASVCVYPVKTNAGFLVRALESERFKSGDVDTGFIISAGAALSDRPVPNGDLLTVAARTFADEYSRFDRSPWRNLVGFRLNSGDSALVHMRLAGEPVVAKPRCEQRVWSNQSFGWFEPSTQKVVLFERGDIYEFTLDTGEAEGGELAAGDGAILSPMPGKIVSVAAKAGAKLKKGDPILVLEAMKMEHTLTAPFDGKLVELNAKAGAQVSEGVVLAKMEAAQDA